MIYPKPTTGQSIWFVPAERSGGGNPRYLTVTKVGRKYFECGKFTRFWIETWREESCFNHGRAYPSEAQCAAQTRLDETWKALRMEMSRAGYTPPTLLTLDDLHTFANRCGFALELP